MQVLVHREAEEEILGAQAWYARCHPGLELEFTRSLEAAVSAVVRDPDAFTPVANGCRRALLRRFPYSLVYSVEGDTLVVLALFHQRRNPAKLGDRLR